jgi:hypothetical protein
LGRGEDQVGKRRDVGAWDIEPCAEVIPKAGAELGEGLGEAEKGIAGVATEIAAGAGRDFALCDVTANFRSRSHWCAADFAAPRALPPCWHTFGETVIVRRRLVTNHVEMAVILQPDGSLAFLPAWIAGRIGCTLLYTRIPNILARIVAVTAR